MRRPVVVLAALLAVTGVSPAGGFQDREEDPLLGAPSEIVAEAPADTVRLAPGDRLLRAPTPSAPVLATLDVEVELAVLERRGEWVRVELGDWTGWLVPGTGGGDPTSAATPAADEPPVAADPARLARAESLLGSEAKSSPLGPWTLYTDVYDRRLLQHLRRAAFHLPSAFADRYGLPVHTDGAQVVVLFDGEDDYRAYEEDFEDLAELQIQGHAGYGIAALFVGRRDGEQIQRLFVHELVHLLNRATLGRDLPAWIEEGLANDLAFSRVDRKGRILGGTIAGSRRVEEGVDRDAGGAPRRTWTVFLEGPMGSLNRLAREVAANRHLPLETLVGLSWREFVEPEGRELRYAESAFFVRYLLDAEKGRLAPGFKAYLARLAAGERPEPGELPAALGRTWKQLERGFRGWLRIGASVR